MNNDISYKYLPISVFVVAKLGKNHYTKKNKTIIKNLLVVHSVPSHEISQNGALNIF